MYAPHGGVMMVPLTGLEPVRYRYRGILSPLCLPIPQQRHTTEGMKNFTLYDNPKVSICQGFCTTFERIFLMI